MTKLTITIDEEIDMFDDNISYDDGSWRKSDDMRFPNTLLKHSKLGKGLEETETKKVNKIKALNIIETLGIEGNIDFKKKIAQHIVLKKEEKPSTFKTKTIIAHELSENHDEFKEIANEVINSYNKQHTLKVFGEEEEEEK